MTWAESKAMMAHGAKVRAVGYKTNMTPKEKKAWHSAYSKIWHAAKSEGLTMKQWRAAQLERIKKPK